MSRRKSYAFEEFMSTSWIERWAGFASLKHARSFAKKMDAQCHGRLRIVRITRQVQKFRTKAQAPSR